MQINLPPQLLATLNLSSSGEDKPVETTTATAQLLRAGQILNATLLRIQSSTLLNLRINGQEVQAKLQSNEQLPVKAGQDFTVKVVSAGKQPLLQVVNTHQLEQTLVSALRVALPRQAPLPPLLSNIAAVAQSPEKLPVTLPPDVIKFVKELFLNLPTSRTISTPEGLKNAIRDSGLFLESKLSQQASSVQQPVSSSDFKAGLLRLLASLLTHTENVKPTESQNTLAGKPASGQPDGQRALSQQAQTQANVANLRSTASGQSINVREAQVKTLNQQSGNVLPTNARGHNIQPPLPPVSTNIQIPFPDNKQNAEPKHVDTKKTNIAKSDLATKTSNEPHTARNVTTTKSAPVATLLEQSSSTRATAEMLQQTNSGVSRVQLNQLNMVAVDDAAKPAISLELPIRHNDHVDVFDLQIDEEETQNEETENARLWRINLSFDLVHLGAVHAMLTLVNQQITADMWMEQEATTRLFQQHLEILAGNMRDKGLSVGRLSFNTGEPPPILKTNDEAQLLLDIQI